MLAIMVTKLKGNEEVSWCRANGIIAGVLEMESAREGVAVMLNAMAQCSYRLRMY